MDFFFVQLVVTYSPLGLWCSPFIQCAYSDHKLDNMLIQSKLVFDPSAYCKTIDMLFMALFCERLIALCPVCRYLSAHRSKDHTQVDQQTERCVLSTIVNTRSHKGNLRMTRSGRRVRLSGGTDGLSFHTLSTRFSVMDLRLRSLESRLML